MSEFDSFVLTSRWEGMPTVLLDAAALGIPLIVVPETNFAGYVKEFGCGLIIEKNTPVQIAESSRPLSVFTVTVGLHRCGAPASDYRLS